jgi:hypothetical protein
MRGSFPKGELRCNASSTRSRILARPSPYSTYTPPHNTEREGNSEEWEGIQVLMQPLGLLPETPGIGGQADLEPERAANESLVNAH